MCEIAFFGSSLVSAYWNDAATYYRGIVKALDALGHRVTFFEPDAYGRQEHRDMDEPDWAAVRVYAGEGPEVHQALEEGMRADVVVKASGVGVFDELLESAVLELRKPDQIVIFWDVDAPATLDRVREDPADPFRALIPRYDFILTYGGGQPVVDAYMDLGAKSCVPVYNALDPDTHHPEPARPEFHADLSFLGNRLPDREARVEEFFLKAAKLLPNKTFLIGGNGWSDKDLPKNVGYLGHVYTRDHNALNCSAKVVLNVSRQSMADYGFSPTTRVFEAAGAGACLLTDSWEGIEEFFEPGREVLVAEDGEETAAVLKKLTARKAASIGKAALKRVLAEHTYAHRAAQVDRLLAW